MSVEQLANPEAGELATLLIPVDRQNLILPNVSVAEILDYSAPKPVEEMPSWFLGLLTWRMIEVPLVSFEGLNKQPVLGREGNIKIAIMNGISNNDIMPFWGVVVQGTPRLMRVTEAELQEDASIHCGPAELMAVKFGIDVVHIPNIEFMEREILALNIL